MMGETVWNVRSNSYHTDVKEIYEGLPTMFTLRIQHGGLFSKSPGRKYVFGKLNYVDFVDMDEFSIHELNVMFEALGYPKEACRYHFCIPDLNLDLGLLPLRNDQDVIRLSTYTTKHKEIRVYSEHERSTLDTYLMSPTKVVTDDIVDVEEIHSLEIGRHIKKRKESRSCSKKIDFDLNEPSTLPLVVYNKNQQERPRFPYEKFIRPKPVLNVTIPPKTVTNESVTNDIVPMEEDEPLAYQPQMDFLDPLFDFGPNDMPYNGRLEDDYDIGSFEEHIFQDEEQLVNDLDKMVVNDGLSSGEGGSDSEDGGSDSDGGSRNDSDFIVDEDEVIDDFEVYMSEFHSVVDKNVEWLHMEKNKEIMETNDAHGEELEVIDADKFEFAGYEEDKRKRMLKELRKPKYCSAGELHKSAFSLGDTFATKEQVTNLVKEHALETRRDLHLVKNDKLRIRAGCKGVPPNHHKQVGRPRKKRTRGAEEVVTQSSQGTKLTRKFLTVTCKKCHNKGHNSRTCKGQGGPSQGEPSQGGPSQGGPSQGRGQGGAGQGRGRGRTGKGRGGASQSQGGTGQARGGAPQGRGGAGKGRGGSTQGRGGACKGRGGDGKGQSSRAAGKKKTGAAV